jgi:hypothetical protein
MADHQTPRARGDSHSVDAGTEPKVPRMPTHRDRWAVMATTSHSPRRWAAITEAIRIADAAPRNAFGDTMIRGGEDWCRLAITALESPHIAARSERHPATLPDRCLADAALLGTWLNAPHAYANPVVATNADALSLVDWAEAGEDSVHRAMDNLLTAAQDVGVYGVSGFRIELHRLNPREFAISEAFASRNRSGGGA